jgi:hypothetical protein
LVVQFIRRWLSQICDPIRAAKGFLRYPHFFYDWYRYVHLPGAEPIHFRDIYPQVHDRTKNTPFDSHYLYVNNWAMRRILSNSPDFHVDVGSQVMFTSLLASMLPVLFLDYRPLNAKINGLRSVRGDILRLPFQDCSIESISCLHVAEHIGLGRYGDMLDTAGTQRACQELARVLRGDLYFALPIGRHRLCFNAHRIHTAECIVYDYFSDLKLKEFSGVHDDGRWVQEVDLNEFNDRQYACGMFWFQKDK